MGWFLEHEVRMDAGIVGRDHFFSVRGGSWWGKGGCERERERERVGTFVGGWRLS